jgi:hypothetical protein
LDTAVAAQPTLDHPQTVQQVNALTIGAWISMKNRLGDRVPCKIAVIYNSTGKMVVVDKSGLRVGEFLRKDLIDLIMAGEASILEQGDNFENYLARIIQTLRKDS